MSINYQGLEGQTNGKIGCLSFYMMNEQNVIRCLPTYNYNRKTTLQQKNRKNMAILIQFFQQLKPVLYNTLNERPENRAVYHHFLALNLAVSTIYGMFYPELFVFSGTGLDYTTFSIHRNESEGSQFFVTGTLPNRAINQQMTLSRRFYFSETKQCFDFDMTQYKRSSGNCNLIFDEKFKTDECYIYLCFVRQDIAISSNSYYQLFNAAT
jgi:hypothetical protein